LPNACFDTGRRVWARKKTKVSQAIRREKEVDMQSLKKLRED